MWVAVVEAHNPTREVVFNNGYPPTEWPTLDQRFRQPGNPETSNRHDGQVRVPDMIWFIGTDGFRTGFREITARFGMRFLFQDSTNCGRCQVKSRASQNLGDLHFAKLQTKRLEPLDQVTNEVGNLLTGSRNDTKSLSSRRFSQDEIVPSLTQLFAQHRYFKLKRFDSRRRTTSGSRQRHPSQREHVQNRRLDGRRPVFR